MSLFTHPGSSGEEKFFKIIKTAYQILTIVRRGNLTTYVGLRRQEKLWTKKTDI